MSTLNELIADCVEDVTGVSVDPDTLHFVYYGRHFRALIHEDLDVLQICDGDFDRWANSVGGLVSPCPVTADGMSRAIDFLISTHAL